MVHFLLVKRGGEGSQSCPASDGIESARRNCLSESIHSSQDGLLRHYSNTSLQCPSSWISSYVEGQCDLWIP